MVTDRVESDREQELAEKLFKSASQAENVNKIDAALKAAEPLPRIERPRRAHDDLALALALTVFDLSRPEPVDAGRAK